MKTDNKKVMLALSGGVDSSVCAELLKDGGYEVRAVVMMMSDAHTDTVNAARTVAAGLDIPLTVLDLRNVFKKNVIEPFIEAYCSGRTPNPCVICNPLVKFRFLCEEADAEGCSCIATGHYARIGEDNGRFFVQRALSLKRDQSYMLYRLSQDVLARLLLPLGNLEKDAVRARARDTGISSADAPDSQENCFIPDNDYIAYIEKVCGNIPEGDFISPEGKIIGRHRGIHRYTVGQRKGLGISLGRPAFVSEIDPIGNTVQLSYEGGQFRDYLEVSDCVFMSVPKLSAPMRAEVKIRSAALAASALVAPVGINRVSVKFDRPVKAPSPGQSAVFYLGDSVLGGGFIALSE